MSFPVWLWSEGFGGKTGSCLQEKWSEDGLCPSGTQAASVAKRSPSLSLLTGSVAAAVSELLGLGELP